MKCFSRIWAAAAVVSVLLAGCAVDQKREVEIYRRVLDEGQPGLTSVYCATDPLTLQQALIFANTNNEALSVSGEDYLQALIDKDIAFARFLPTIAFAPAYLRQEKTAMGADNTLINKFVRDRSLDLPVDGQLTAAPFTDVPALGAAVANARGKHALLLDFRAVLLLDVSQVYYQVLRSETEAGVLENSVTAQTRQVTDMRVRRRAGVSLSLDVARAEAQLAGTRASLIQARNDAKNGRAMLALLLGVPAVDGPLTDGFDVPKIDWPLDALLRQAEVHRQDLQAARAQVEAASENLQAAWGRYFPSVSLNLTRYLSRESFPNDVDWTALLQVHVPIFSAGLIHAEVRTAYSRLRQANLSESLVRRQILRDLRSARENLEDVGRRIEELEFQVLATREAMHQIESARQAGVATNFERLSARDKLLKAELDKTSARFEQTVNYLRLLRVVGCLDTALRPLPEMLQTGLPATENINTESP